jgi:hypothetical protein
MPCQPNYPVIYKSPDSHGHLIFIRCLDHHDSIQCRARAKPHMNKSCSRSN